MNEFESFTGGEQAEGFDPAAFERFQEKMRENAKQAKKDKAQEKKQQEDESDLYQILKHIINTLGVEHILAKVIIDCLASSVNPHLIVLALSLNFKSIQKKLNIRFKTKGQKTSNSKSIILDDFDQTLPEFIKLNLGLYFQTIQKEFSLQLNWNLKKFQDHKDSPQAFKNLISIIIQEYLQLNKQNFNGENVNEFTNKFVNTLLNNNFSNLESGKSKKTITE